MSVFVQSVLSSVESTVCAAVELYSVYIQVFLLIIKMSLTK